MSKSKILASAAEVNRISRYMLIWANAWSEKPVKTIDYEMIRVDTGEGAGMALTTIQGTYITKRYVLGGYQGEYQFELIYRVKPGDSNDARLSADELLNAFGDWARDKLPDLGDGIRAVKVEPTTQASKFAAYEDGYEDHQILMKLTYEVI